MRRFIAAAVALTAALGLGVVGAQAAGEAKHPRTMEKSWEGPFGRFDMAQVQRGFQVYKEVCSACHSMNLMHYRNLGEKGGPYYDPKFPNANENPYVRAIAAGYTIADRDAEGTEIERPGRPSDPFLKPFADVYTARAANGGKEPPDLSVIIKARHGGADYVYSFLTGYNEEPPKGKEVPSGLYYNPYFAGGLVGMAPVIFDDRVTYQESEGNKGIKGTESQIAQDVVAFLTWASEPKQQLRKETGLAVMIYLFILSLLLYISYKQIWRNVEH